VVVGCWLVLVGVGMGEGEGVIVVRRDVGSNGRV